ncbi:DotD/TraH family lipoprotein [Facilibium subflavum]|uniref:DotD/TraH family lipoprotein n=1 Tax=Facilibium subflavum TaxID=2219058 RepID=UPI0013C35CFE|nr:DotD/TraH family lipoprotein [Facilibium subflavum]
MIILLTLTLSSCASQAPIVKKVDYEKQLLQEISNSSKSIDTTLNQLSLIENPDGQKAQLPFSNIKNHVLQKRVELSWYGDITPLLEKIASVTGYQFQVYGKKPHLPILIQVGSPKQPVITTILHVLQNVQIQAKNSAFIYINQENKILSLRYEQ